jgi:hypothetical protein
MRKISSLTIKIIYISKYSFSNINSGFNLSIQTKKSLKYYRPSEKINTLFFARFDFRFQEINNSLVTKSFI